MGRIKNGGKKLGNGGAQHTDSQAPAQVFELPDFLPFLL